MLVIRKDQLTVLGQSALENRLLAHIEAHFPVHWRLIDRKALLQVIQIGKANARRYSLSTQREIGLFVGLMLYFGSAFDTDYQLPWIAQLSDADAPDPFSRLANAHEAATAYLYRVAGPSGSNMRGAIERFISQANDDRDLVARLEWLYPEKMLELSGAMRAALLSQAASLARQFNLDDRGVWVFAALSLLLGHRFYDDPQHCWVGDVLNTADDSHRVSALTETAALHLHRWFEEET